MDTPKLDEAAIFNVARRIDDRDGRRLYVHQICGGDSEAERRIEALLRIHDEERGFLESPIDALAIPPESDGKESVGTQIGPYKLIELIGEGGFGVVYMAEQQQPIRRKVAVKILKPGMDSRHVIARFEAERQALALMEHANIARVLDAGETGSGRPYFVMELVKGIPINRYCDEHQLTPRERLALFVPVCQAIQHAHQKGIIHRDLKPTNVLVAAYDSRPVPKVIDFGVAKALGQPLTERTLATGFGGIVGTLEYMSPEQAEFNALDVDTRADIYSLGVLLYELLTGTTPLTKKQLSEAAVTEVLRLIREQEPPRPSTRLSDSKDSLASISAQRKLEPARLTKELRGELDWIVMKCLEKDRNRRYETANGVVRDIERYLNHEPVEAGPPSASYKLRKLARKHRSLLGAAGTFVLLVAVSVVVSIWLAVRARIAEHAADQERDKAIAEKKRGDEEAAVAKAINEFLQNDLLGQADIANQPPGTTRDRDLTVRELLDRAAQRIEARFQDQPLTEAAIRTTLGMAYQALGDYEKALKHLERSFLLRSETLGTRERETLECMNGIAALWWQRGQPDKAEALYRAALTAHVEALGEDHFATLEVVNNLAILDANHGRYDEAEAKFQRLLNIHLARGASSAKTLRIMSNLAAVYQQQGEYAKAESLAIQIVEEFRSHYGADHPQTLFNMNNLATGYLQQEQYDKAEPLFDEVLRARRAKLEPGHPDTLTTMNDLAVVYQEQHLYDKSERLLREALDIAKNSRRDPNHPLAFKLKNSLATLCAMQGRFDEAEPLFEELLQSRRATLTADHPDTLISIYNLGTHYRLRGFYEKAEPLLTEAVNGARVKLTIRHPNTQKFIENLATLHEMHAKPQLAEPLWRELVNHFRDNERSEGPGYITYLVRLTQNLLSQKKYAEAEPAAHESLNIRTKNEPDLWTTFHTQVMLGSALLGQEKFAEAEPLLLAGYQGMKDRSTQIPNDARNQLDSALNYLTQLYDAWKKPDQAAYWRNARTVPR